MEIDPFIFRLSIFILSIFIGYYVVWSVTPSLQQIDFSNSPEVVSTDFVGSRAACVFDAQATIVNGRHAVLYLWYDNEYGYSCQVYRVLEKMAGIKYLTYPPTDTGGL